jgi:hypothetical protein
LEVVGNRPSSDDILEIMPILEIFLVLMYHITSESPTVNGARKDLFTRNKEIGITFHQVQQPCFNM